MTFNMRPSRNLLILFVIDHIIDRHLSALFFDCGILAAVLFSCVAVFLGAIIKSWEPCMYEDDGLVPMLTASVLVPQPVSIGLGLSLEEERENLDMELLGPANNGYTIASTFITSAANKHTYIFDEKEETYNAWITKPVKRWIRTDIMSWILTVATDNGIPYEHVLHSGFRDCNDGLAFSTLTEEDFMKLEPNHGAIFYKALQETLNRWNCPSYDEPYRGYGEEKTLPNFYTSFRSDAENQAAEHQMSTWSQPQLNLKQDEKIKCEMPSSDGDSEGEVPEIKTVVKKKGVGRPPREPRSRRRKQEKKCGRLWEFIRDLLKDNKHCPNDICWVDHDEGTFRFVKSEKVAKLWGDIKENPKMNYEKLSRAMRYYYKSQVLLPVLGRRLVYKFGPNATNWRSNNPNFRF